jgi:hypothetical protein
LSEAVEEVDSTGWMILEGYMQVEVIHDAIVLISKRLAILSDSFQKPVHCVRSEQTLVLG